MNGTSVFNLLGKLAISGTEEAKKELKEVSKSGEETKNKLSKNLKEAAQKVGELGDQMAKGLAVGITAITASYEATKEFRSDLGRLEAGYEGVGLSGDTANRVFKEFYGILGETDTAVEASNLLKELAQDEKGLAEWTTIATGIYSRFPDSIPIEALIESANETAKVGKVTGNLADSLNWAGVSEEEFNKKLAKCNTEAKREELIRKTLNGLYSDSANEYQKNNKGLIDNNKAQADLNMQMADTMEKIEPIITQGKIFIAEVLLKLQPLITWVIDNFDLIGPIVLGIVGALKLFSVTMGIVNAVMAASPVTWIVLGIVAAIAALVTIIVLVVKHWDSLKNAAINAWNMIKEVWGTVAEWFNTFIIQPIVNFFTGLWTSIQAIWDGILLGIQIFIGVVVSLFDAAFQIITLPFMFIWENCKEYVFAAFEWIKEKIGIAIDFIKSLVSKGFELVRKYIIDPITKAKDWIVEAFLFIKDKISEKIEQVKEFIRAAFEFIREKIITPISNAKDKVVNTIKNLVDGVKEKFNNFKTSVSNTFTKIKEAITSPIEKAKEVISGIVEKIKGFFNFKVELPKIKLPHFGITPKGWSIGDLTKGVIPKLGIEWYAKAVKAPMLLDDPTAFGISPNGNIRVGGEAGSEIVGGTSTIMSMISNAVSSNNSGIEYRLDKLNSNLANYTEAIRNLQVVLSTGELVGAIASPMDEALGVIADDRRRGR